MSAALTLACLWAIAATVVALLPMRLQMVPGLALLVAAPVLIVWIGVDHGIWWALGATAGFLSMFRNPLIYFGRKALGLPVRDPREGRT
jgi:Protein of unknown function (DUF2484)